MTDQSTTSKEGKLCLTRRRFLMASGTAGTASVLMSIPGMSKPVWAKTVNYPKKTIGKLSKMKTDKEVIVDYPDEDSPVVLVKLGTPAGGGVGPGGDIVAFSAVCTHMGADLDASYKAKHKGLGPCPLHMTSFDLTRHGIVTGGHATESLPQIALEIKGDYIIATGVSGLIYGRSANL
jgi:arsenite oxidase small subunit